MPEVTSAGKLRYGTIASVTGGGRLRYSTSHAQSMARLRYASGLQAKSMAKLRYAALSPTFEATWTTNSAGPGATDEQSVPQVSILVDGVELCPAPYILQITLAENEPIRWTLSILDPEAYYHPKKAGPWFGKLNDNPSRQVDFSIRWGGAELAFRGSPNRYRHTRTAADAGQVEFEWSGIDATSRNLFRTGQTLPTLRTTQSTIYTTKTAAADLLNALSIPHNLEAMEGTVIRFQHRQDSRPGDLFQGLLDVLWHKWGVIGNTLHVYKPNYHGPAQWTYGTDAAIFDDDLESETPAFVNVATARRVREASQGSVNTQEHTTFGQYPVTFNPPLRSPSWRVLQDTGGLYSDFLLYSEGTLAAVREARQNSNWSPSLVNQVVNGPIDRIVFSWGAPAGIIATGGLGRIQFFGAEDAKDLPGVANDETYSIRKRNQTSLAAGDDRNHLELQPSSYIPDAATMARHLVGFLVEEAADREPQTLRVALNLLLAPGQRVIVEDDRLGTSEKRYIRRVTHSISSDPAQRFSRITTTYFDPNLTIEDDTEEEA
jgi:hypothetical protein